MRFRYTTAAERRARDAADLQAKFDWHRHFCLLPTAHKGTVYWMEPIERRATSYSYNWEGTLIVVWEYRPLGGNPK